MHVDIKYLKGIVRVYCDDITQYCFIFDLKLLSLHIF